MGRVDDLPLPVPIARTPAILIVEDEALIRLALSDFLKDCGYHVLEASNADDAVLILQLDEVKIDFVFSDIRMPGVMDGFGLSKWVKANLPELPIVLASADTTKSKVAEELCADEKFFNKPYAMELVEAHIREVLRARRNVD